MLIVYFDTNVYIGAKYIFDADKMLSIKKLLENHKIKLLYASANIGEVKQHIKNDIEKEVNSYNKLLRKELEVVKSYSDYSLAPLNSEEIISKVTKKLEDFLALDGVDEISLNPLDAEKLMDDYFNQRPPFEHKKPYEFKDAIMINALYKYQESIEHMICVVSSDDGFRHSFKDKNFMRFQYLGEFIKHHNTCEELTEKIFNYISDKLSDMDFDDKLIEYISKFDIDRNEYSNYECENKEINKIICDLLYIDGFEDERYATISIDTWITMSINHRDEERSYYDKEEDRYLIERFVHGLEKHRVTLEITICCKLSINEEITLTSFKILEEAKTIDLDDSTMISYEEISSTLDEKSNLEYCYQCNNLIGTSNRVIYWDCYGNSLCSSCMQKDKYGDICPCCGVKVEHNFMRNGFCVECEPNQY